MSSIWIDVQPAQRSVDLGWRPDVGVHRVLAHGFVARWVAVLDAMPVALPQDERRWAHQHHPDWRRWIDALHGVRSSQPLPHSLQLRVRHDEAGFTVALMGAVGAANADDAHAFAQQHSALVLDLAPPRWSWRGVTVAASAAALLDDDWVQARQAGEVATVLPTVSASADPPLVLTWPAASGMPLVWQAQHRCPARTLLTVTAAPVVLSAAEWQHARQHPACTAAWATPWHLAVHLWSDGPLPRVLEHALVAGWNQPVPPSCQTAPMIQPRTVLPPAVRGARLATQWGQLLPTPETTVAQSPWRDLVDAQTVARVLCIPALSAEERAIYRLPPMEDPHD